MIRWARAAISAALLLASAAAACAQDAPAETPIPGLKHESTALSHSFFGTGLPIAVGVVLDPVGGDAAAGIPILVGWWFGPSLGHFYASRPKRALVGIGIRTAALAGLAGALAMGSGSGSEFPTLNTLGAVSIVVGVSSMFYDIGEAPTSVRRHNEEIRRGHATITPAVIGEARAPGLRVDWIF